MEAGCSSCSDHLLTFAFTKYIMYMYDEVPRAAPRCGLRDVDLNISNTLVFFSSFVYKIPIRGTYCD